MARVGPALGMPHAERASGVAPIAWLVRQLEAEQERWFLWLPVMFGGGIALYFLLPVEPWTVAAMLPVVAALAVHLTVARGAIATLMTGALLATALGIAAAKLRTEVVRAPVLQKQVGPVDVYGFVELVEPRASKGQRLTIRVTALEKHEPHEWPYRVRVRTMTETAALEPGNAVRLKATLSPPPGPALPGDYDFARAAWFQGLGAVGYATAAPELVASAVEPPLGLRVTRGGRAAAPGHRSPRRRGAARPDRRHRQCAHHRRARRHLGGDQPGVPGLGPLPHPVDLRPAHGDHGRRRVLLDPSHRWPPSRRSRCATRSRNGRRPGAMAGAFGYLMISGAAFATVRSYIMISIMFLAVMLDRPALALRNVALAALAILLVWPESLFDPGFQMSFAAVVALVAAYEWLRQREEERAAVTMRGSLRQVLLFFGGIITSTLIASLAVAPFGIYHFHNTQQFAILANLVAIPICNVVVMPAALATLVAMPFGLEAAPLRVMGWGIEAMVWCANWVASLPGAVGRVPAIPDLRVRARWLSAGCGARCGARAGGCSASCPSCWG